ncbi:MAG: hypothetical protein ACREH9_09790, partial [Pseudomonadota bacterium]
MLESCSKFLTKYPDHATFGELKTEAERRQEQAYLEDLQRRVAAEPNLENRIQLLVDGLERYAGEPWIQDELQFARNKLGLVNSIAEQAQACEAAGQLDEALEKWTSLASIYKGYANLDAQIDRIRRKQAEIRLQAVARWAEQLEQEVKAGDVDKASELMVHALAEFPDAAALNVIAKRLEAIRAKKSRARELMAQGQAACEKGGYREASAILRQAFESGKDDSAFRKLVLNALMKYARDALKGDWREADALVREAAALEPGHTAPEDLRRSIADRRKDEAVNAWLAKVEELRKAGDVRGALSEIERALSEYPGEPRIKRVRSGLAAEVQAQRSQVIAELRRIQQEAPGATGFAQLDEWLQRVRELAGQHQADAEVRGLADGAAREL